jgi:hypothetical protein
VLIRGNLRADRLQVFQAVCDKVKELFADKYTVLMVEDPEAFEGGSGAERPPPRSSSGSGSRAGGSGSTREAASQLEPRVAFQVCVCVCMCVCVCARVRACGHSVFVALAGTADSCLCCAPAMVS